MNFWKNGNRTIVALAEASQILERVDPGAVSITPRNLDGVLSDGLNGIDLKFARLENGQEHRSSTLFALDLARSARTGFPEIPEGIPALMLVVPAYGDLLGRCLLYAKRKHAII